jgi:hypothetical protein
MSHSAVDNLHSRTRVVISIYSETVCSFSVIKTFMVMAMLRSVTPRCASTRDGKLRRLRPVSQALIRQKSGRMQMSQFH